MADKVFIALQNNPDAQPIIEAVLEDNPNAVLNETPGMVKIDCPGRLVVRRESIEEKIGRDFDLQEIHVNLISLGGNIDEDDDEFVLSWGARAQ
ncbi:MAG: MmoB/DmpM family protein [Gammaproteobacteria bacterium]